MSRSRRILMFAPAFPPFANPEAIVNGKLALAFQAAGWEVDVISRNLSGVSPYDYGSGWSEPWLPLKDVTHATCYKHGSSVHRLIDTVRGAIRVGHVLPGCRWASHALEMALGMNEREAYDLIISRALPESAHLPALAMTKRTKLPWVANWNDPFGEKNPPPVGMGSNAKIGRLHGKFIEDVARNASWLTFPSERMRQYVCSYLALDTVDKSSAIPHVMLDAALSVQREEHDAFNLCYAGNLYASREPEVFLKGLIIFLNTACAWQSFRLIVIGLESVALSNLVKRFGLEKNVVICGTLSYHDTLIRASHSDALLVLEAPYEEGIYLPSKFVDYVQTGLPILAASPTHGVLHDIIANHGGGIAVDCRSAHSIAEALGKLFSCWRSGTLLNVYGSQGIQSIFAPAAVIGLYETIFQKLVK